MTERAPERDREMEQESARTWDVLWHTESPARRGYNRTKIKAKAEVHGKPGYGKAAKLVAEIEGVDFEDVRIDSIGGGK